MIALARGPAHTIQSLIHIFVRHVNGGAAFANVEYTEHYKIATLFYLLLDNRPVFVYTPPKLRIGIREITVSLRIKG